MKKSNRGSVGRAFRYKERYDNDEEFRKKENKRGREYHHKNREKENKRSKAWGKEVSKFVNRKCKKCKKLLNWKTKGDYCKKHFWIGRRKKYGRKGKKIKIS